MPVFLNAVTLVTVAAGIPITNTPAKNVCQTVTAASISATLRSVCTAHDGQVGAGELGGTEDQRGPRRLESIGARGQEPDDKRQCREADVRGVVGVSHGSDVRPGPRRTTLKPKASRPMKEKKAPAPRTKK